MDGYILELRNKYGHMTTKKPQYSPHKHRPINYSAKQQIVQPTDTSPPLNDKGINRVQGIVGALIYARIEVNNKLLVSLSAIGAQEAVATKETAVTIEQLMDYVATYPYDGILFRNSDIILAVHTIQDVLTNQEIEAYQVHIYYSQKMILNQNSIELS